MALTLSVGFVVDDAIVMLENIVRHMEMGKSPMQASFDGFEGGRLHDSLDDRVACRGVHPRAVHGRDRRPAAARVRGHDWRRHPGVRLCVDQPHADAVQPVPEAAACAAARLASTTRPSACSTRGWVSTIARSASRSASRRRDDGGLGRAGRPARRICSRWSRRGSCRAKTRAASIVNTRRCRASASRTMVRHQLQVDDVLAGGSERRRIQRERRVGGSRRRRTPAACSSSSSRASERSQSVDDMIAQPAAEDGADSRACASS